MAKLRSRRAARDAWTGYTAAGGGAREATPCAPRRRPEHALFKPSAPSPPVSRPGPPHAAHLSLPRSGAPSWQRQSRLDGRRRLILTHGRCAHRRLYTAGACMHGAACRLGRPGGLHLHHAPSRPPTRTGRSPRLDGISGLRRARRRPGEQRARPNGRAAANGDESARMPPLGLDHRPRDLVATHQPLPPSHRPLVSAGRWWSGAWLPAPQPVRPRSLASQRPPRHTPL